MSNVVRLNSKPKPKTPMEIARAKAIAEWQWAVRKAYAVLGQKEAEKLIGFVHSSVRVDASDDRNWT